MTFLDPTAAIIAAGIGVPVLLALYLLKLRRRPVRVSTVLFWPRATEDVQANVPLKMLRPSWLLLLHLLILGCFAAALGRPTVIEGAPAAERVLLLLDTSASMAAVDSPGGPTRLERAKERALDLVDRLRRAGGRREVAIIAFAAEARAVTGFTSARAVIADALESVQQTDQPGNLGEAIKLADAIAAGAGDEETDQPPTAVLLSDGSFRDQGRLPASTPRLRFEPVGGAGATDNLGIVGFSARRDAADPAVVRVFVDVMNTGVAGVAAPLALSVDGAVQQRRALEVGGASAEAPGRASTIFELRSNAGGVILVQLGREDALASDNSAALVLPPAERPGILLVVPDAAEGAGLTAATWILEDVLAELRARTLRKIGAAEYERLAAAGGLGEFDLIVFDRVTPARLPSAATISFGAVPEVAGLQPGDGGPTGVLFWQRSHPVLRNVALDAVQIARTAVLRTAEPAPGAERVNTITELARGSDGPLMVMVQEGAPETGGTRRLIVGFELAASNWPLQAGFAIFLADSVDYLTLRADAAAGRAFRTGEGVEVRVRPGAAGRVALRGPAEVVLRDEGAAGSTLSAGLLPRAGVYVVEGASALDRAVAVNVADEVESALARPEGLEVAGRIVEGVRGTAGPMEVWWWFVLIACGLLLVEWVVYGWSVRA